MNLSSIYGGFGPAPQAADSAMSPDRRESPPQQSQPAAMPHGGVAFSWVGALIALVLLRVIYEVSE